MPIILQYFSKRYIWIFLFFGTDVNENRAHIHAGKVNSEKACKIWLEPNVEVAKQGSLTDKEITTVLKIVSKHREKLFNQWVKFKKGEKTTKIKVYENS